MSKKLLDIVRDKIRVKHYSIKTEKSYVSWIKRYIFFHKLRHPNEMGKREIEQFLTHLAVERNVSPTTQNQAFNALLFLYEQVLGISLKDQNIQILRPRGNISTFETPRYSILNFNHRQNTPPFT